MIKKTGIGLIAVLATAGMLSAGSLDVTGTAALSASRDATLIEHPEGAVADSGGTGFRAGRTGQNQNSIRRGLIAFDVVRGVPPGSRILSATLIVHTGGNNDAPSDVSLHRIADAWGVGSSVSAGGGGVPATPADPTWLHRFHNPAAPDNSPAWELPGGDYVSAASATTTVGASDYYEWSSQAMVEDVQRWLDSPQRSHGWIVIGDESTSQTSKLFDSTDATNAAFRPVLLVEYTARSADAVAPPSEEPEAGGVPETGRRRAISAR